MYVTGWVGGWVGEWLSRWLVGWVGELQGPGLVGNLNGVLLGCRWAVG